MQSAQPLGAGSELVLCSVDSTDGLDHRLAGEALPNQVVSRDGAAEPRPAASRNESAEQDWLNAAAAIPDYFPPPRGHRRIYLLPVLGLLGVLLTFLCIAEFNRPGPFVPGPFVPEPEPEPEPEREPEPAPVYLVNPCPGRFSEPVTTPHPAFARWAALDDTLRMDMRGEQVLPTWLSARDTDFPCTGGSLGRCGARSECCTCCTEDPQLQVKQAEQVCQAAAQAEGWVSYDYYGHDGRPHRPFSDLPAGQLRCETLRSSAGALWADSDGDGCNTYVELGLCDPSAGGFVTSYLNASDRVLTQRWLDDPAQYDAAYLGHELGFDRYAPSDGPFEGITALEACCECGGGQAVVQELEPEPEPEPDPVPPRPRVVTTRQVDKYGNPIGDAPPPPPAPMYTPSQLIWHSTLSSLMGPLVVVVMYLVLVAQGLETGRRMRMMRMEWWRKYSNMLAMYSLDIWCINLTQQGALGCAWHWIVPITAIILSGAGFLAWGRVADFLSAGEMAPDPSIRRCDETDDNVLVQLVLLYLYSWLVQILSNVMAFQTGYCVCRHYMNACTPTSCDGGGVAELARTTDTVNRRSKWRPRQRWGPVWESLGYLVQQSVPLIPGIYHLCRRSLPWQTEGRKLFKESPRFNFVRMVLHGAHTHKDPVRRYSQYSGALDFNEVPGELNVSNLFFDAAQRLENVHRSFCVVGSVLTMAWVLLVPWRLSAPGCVTIADLAATMVVGWSTTMLWLTTRQAAISAAVVCFTAEPQLLAFLFPREYDAVRGQQGTRHMPGTHVFENLISYKRVDLPLSKTNGTKQQEQNDFYSSEERKCIEQQRDEEFVDVSDADLVKNWARWVALHDRMWATVGTSDELKSGGMVAAIEKNFGRMNPKEISELLADISKRLQHLDAEGGTVTLTNERICDPDDPHKETLKLPSVPTDWEWKGITKSLAEHLVAHKAGLDEAIKTRTHLQLPQWTRQMPKIKSERYGKPGQDSYDNDDEALRSYDVFISYRQAEHMAVARTLFGELTTGDDPLKVFWDQECLEDGADWLEGFLCAIRQSKVIVLLVSEKVFFDFLKADGHTQDNVLLEHEYALHMAATGTAKIFLVQIGTANKLDQWLSELMVPDIKAFKRKLHEQTRERHANATLDNLTLSALSELSAQEKETSGVKQLCDSLGIDTAQFLSKDGRLRTSEFHWSSPNMHRFSQQRHCIQASIGLGNVSDTVRPLLEVQWGEHNSTGKHNLQVEDLANPKSSHRLHKFVVQPVREMVEEATAPKGSWRQYSARWQKAVFAVKNDKSMMLWHHSSTANQTEIERRWIEKVKQAVTAARLLPGTHHSEPPCHPSCVAHHAKTLPEEQKQRELDNGAKLILWWDHYNPARQISTHSTDVDLVPTERLNQVQIACRLYERCRNTLIVAFGGEDGLIEGSERTKHIILRTYHRLKVEMEQTGYIAERDDKASVLLSWALEDACDSVEFPQSVRNTGAETASEEWVLQAKKEYIFLQRKHNARLNYTIWPVVVGKGDESLASIDKAIEQLSAQEKEWLKSERQRLQDGFQQHEAYKHVWTQALDVLRSVETSLSIAVVKDLKDYRQQLAYLVAHVENNSRLDSQQVQVCRSGQVATGLEAAASGDHKASARSMSVRSAFAHELEDRNLRLEMFFDDLDAEGYISMKEIYAIPNVHKLRELAETVGMKDPQKNRLETAWQEHQGSQTEEEVDRRSVRNMHRELRKEKKLMEQTEAEIEQMEVDLGSKHERLRRKREQQRIELEKRNAERSEVDAETLAMMQQGGVSEAHKLQKQIDQDEEELQRSMRQREEAHAKVLRLRKELKIIVGTILDKYDTDQNSSLDKVELREYIDDLFGDDYEPEDGDIEMLMAKIDLDHDGRASRSEIVKFLKRLHIAEETKTHGHPLTAKTASQAMKGAVVAIIDDDNETGLEPEPEPERVPADLFLPGR